MSQTPDNFAAQIDAGLARLRATLLAIQPSAAAGRVLDQLARVQALGDSIAHSETTAILRHERDLLYALGIRWLREHDFPTLTITRDDVDAAREVMLCIDNDWDAAAWLLRDGRA